MKTLGNTIRRLFTLSMVFVAVSAMFTVSTMEAWAMPGPMPSLESNEKVQGQTQTITYTGDPGFAFPQVGSIYISEAGSGVVFIPPLTPAYALLPCDANAGAVLFVGTSTVWVLQDAGNAFATALIQINDGTGSVSVTIGNGGGVANVQTSGNAVVQGVGPYVWGVAQAETLPGDGTDDDVMNTLGGWSAGYCGNDGVGGNAVDSSRNDGWLVQEPIGGEILAINTAALLIAGLSTSAIWMIPAAGAVAGTAITLYKLRQK